MKRAPGSFSVRVLDWQSARAEATAIREQVFVAEQGVPRELEMDEHDAHCDHALAYDAEGHAVGTGRLLPDGHLGRMAVRAGLRGEGIGSAILLALVARASDRGIAVVRLHAQTHAAGFYERHGFRACGQVFLEAGIEHVAMQRRTDSPSADSSG